MSNQKYNFTFQKERFSRIIKYMLHHALLTLLICLLLAEMFINILLTVSEI